MTVPCSVVSIDVHPGWSMGGSATMQQCGRWNWMARSRSPCRYAGEQHPALPHDPRQPGAREGVSGLRAPSCRAYDRDRICRQSPPSGSGAWGSAATRNGPGGHGLAMNMNVALCGSFRWTNIKNDIRVVCRNSFLETRKQFRLALTGIDHAPAVLWPMGFCYRRYGHKHARQAENQASD